MRRLARLSKWCPGPETYYDGEPPTDTNRHGVDAGSSNFVNIQRASTPCKHLPTYAHVFGCSAPLTLFMMNSRYASTCWRDSWTLPTSILARDLSVQSPERLGKRTKQPSVRNNCSYRRWGSCGSTVLTFLDDNSSRLHECPHFTTSREQLSWLDPSACHGLRVLSDLGAYWFGNSYNTDSKNHWAIVGARAFREFNLANKATLCHVNNRRSAYSTYHISAAWKRAPGHGHRTNPPQGP